MKLVIGIIVGLVLSWENSSEYTDDIIPSDNKELKTRVFESEYGGFGYDILSRDCVLIHQPMVPIVSGMKGFSSRRAAHQVAILVADKIRHGQLPPTLTLKELNSVLVEQESEWCYY